MTGGAGGHADALLAAAKAAEDQGRHPLAESLLRRAAAEAGGRGAAAVRLAEFLVRRGSLEAAAEAVARLAAADPDEPLAPVLAAQALLARDRRADALEILRTALALDPSRHASRWLAVRILKQDRRHLDAAELASGGFGWLQDAGMLLETVDAAARPPGIFVRLGEAEDYARAMERLFTAVADALRALGPGAVARALATRFLACANLRMVLYTDLDTSALMRARAEVVAAAEEPEAGPAGGGRPAGAEPRGTRTGRGGDGRLRVGVLMTRIGPDVESEGMLPMFVPLDPARFFRGVYVLEDRDGPFAARARAAADEYAVLPGDHAARVEALRARDLDLLLVGNDNTCFHTPLTRLSARRIAPVQATNFVSAVSSFYPTMDAFFVGEAFLGGRWAEAYGEEVVPLPGTGFRLERPDRAAAVRPLSRAELGIPPDALLFASGANVFKIIPEAVRVWAEVLRRCPGSMLLLAPFNRSLTDDQRADFVGMVRGVAAGAGVLPDRVAFAPPLGSRERFRGAMALADVCLDSFPFSGGSTTVDVLEAGVPMVVLAGARFRSKLSEAILTSLGLADWVVPDRPSFVRRAVALGSDPEARRAMRARLAAADMETAFYADAGFADAIAAAYERLVAAARASAG